MNILGKAVTVLKDFENNIIKGRCAFERIDRKPFHRIFCVS